MSKESTKKNIEKIIISQFRSIGKSKGYSVSSNCLFKEQDDFFLYAVIYVRKCKTQLYLYLTYNIKTVQEDDLFWNILGMSSNGKCTPSFRATGAYVAPSFQLDKKGYHIEDNCNLELLCNVAINDFNTATDNFLLSIDNNDNQYYQFILSQENMLRGNLKKMIAHILLKNYSKAFQLVDEEFSNGRRGGFQNDGKDIYYFLHKYCKEKMAFNAL